MNAPSRSSKFKIDQMKEKNQLFCFNDRDIHGGEIDYSFFGRDDSTPHRRIEFILMPCLSYKNFTKSNETVTCKGSVNDWTTSLKSETEAAL